MSVLAHVSRRAGFRCGENSVRDVVCTERQLARQDNKSALLLSRMAWPSLDWADGTSRPLFYLLVKLLLWLAVGLSHACLSRCVSSFMRGSPGARSPPGIAADAPLGTAAYAMDRY